MVDKTLMARQRRPDNRPEAGSSRFAALGARQTRATPGLALSQLATADRPRHQFMRRVALWERLAPCTVSGR